MVALEQVQTSSVIIGTGASAKGNNRVDVLVMAPAPVIYDVRVTGPVHFVWHLLAWAPGEQGALGGIASTVGGILGGRVLEESSLVHPVACRPRVAPHGEGDREMAMAFGHQR